MLLYEAKSSKLVPWVAEQFAQLDTKAHADACRLLVELVGENSDELRLEVEKLALWAKGEEITAEHVEEMVLPRGPVKPWTLTDAWSERDMAGVLAAAQRLLAPGRNAERHRVGARRSRRARKRVPSVRGRRHRRGRGDEAAQAAQRVSREEGLRCGGELG